MFHASHAVEPVIQVIGRAGSSPQTSKPDKSGLCRHSQQDALLSWRGNEHEPLRHLSGIWANMFRQPNAIPRCGDPITRLYWEGRDMEDRVASSQSGAAVGIGGNFATKEIFLSILDPACFFVLHGC
jgi:hypothetical protein